MKSTRIVMGMPITVILADSHGATKDVNAVFDYFESIDNRFSTYKEDSEISRYNRGEIAKKDLSGDMQEVLRLSEQTKQETNGYFDIQKADGTIDTSGLVKGWAIENAAQLLLKKGLKNFCIEAGGDIAVQGKNEKGEAWSVGIQNPFSQKEIVKKVALSDKGIATSGTYIRGQHVYNPLRPEEKLHDIVSITVIGPNVYEADRFATAVFAMQEKGIYFLEGRDDLEGYMINKKGIATMTSGFEKYLC